MSIDWQHFTPWTSLGGGALIGLAAALLYVLSKQIAGISGIFYGLLQLKPGSRQGIGWRAAFLTGLVLAPWIAGKANALPLTSLDGTHLLILFIAGLLTGYGTFIANGCTSGHGVCGLSRLSWRSLVAVLCFMLSGIVTVTVVRHLLGGAS